VLNIGLWAYPVTSVGCVQCSDRFSGHSYNVKLNQRNTLFSPKASAPKYYILAGLQHHNFFSHRMRLDAVGIGFEPFRRTFLWPPFLLSLLAKMIDQAAATSEFSLRDQSKVGLHRVNCNFDKVIALEPRA